MTNREDVIEKAMRKAYLSGWKPFDKVSHYYVCGKCDQESTWEGLDDKYHDDDGGKWHHKTKTTLPFPYEDGWLLGWNKEDMEFDTLRLSDFDIIFNHDFAKALWGECTDTMTVRNRSLNVNQVIDMNGWRYHLQKMVTFDNPVNYLAEYIN